MRNHFDKQLEELNTDLIKMGAMCEEAIAGVSKSLSKGDIELAKEIKENAGEIDHLERSIERRCMKLLLHQQPVAKDLRQISAALKMITDMERIGDQAEDIAEIVILLDGKIVNGIDIIDDMSMAVVKMVTDSIDAFVKMNIKLADSVIKADDVVDDFFNRMKYTIIKMISDNHSDAEYALDLLMISKYLERIGDHATNIAEWVIFAVTGYHKEV